MYTVGKKYKKEKVCPICKGFGEDVDFSSETYGDTCEYCNGTGVVSDSQVQVDGENMQVVELRIIETVLGFKVSDYKHTSI